jgi:hypothetical protein
MQRIKVHALLSFGIALMVASLVSACGGETDEPLGEHKALQTLSEVVGFSPQSNRILYTWHHCCKQNDPFGKITPASRCVIAQLDEVDFKRVADHQYPRVDWATIDTKCWGEGWGDTRMKGCAGFPTTQTPPNFKPVMHGETCSGPDGSILKVDMQNRLVLVETYTYD